MMFWSYFLSIAAVFLGFKGANNIFEPLIFQGFALAVGFGMDRVFDKFRRKNQNDDRTAFRYLKLLIVLMVLNSIFCVESYVIPKEEKAIVYLVTLALVLFGVFSQISKFKKNQA